MVFPFLEFLVALECSATAAKAVSTGTASTQAVAATPAETISAEAVSARAEASQTIPAEASTTGTAQALNPRGAITTGSTLKTCGYIETAATYKTSIGSSSGTGGHPASGSAR